MTRLRDDYDALLVDLDGTAYVGGQPIEHAATVLNDATPRTLFLTNNASKAPADVADHLTSLGFKADADDVVTSAQAAATLVASHVDPGSSVLVVGTDAFCDLLREQGLEPVRSADARPAAVVQGHSPYTAWEHLAEASIAINAGALWIASNLDLTLPNERGMLPGNGSMVAALVTATGSKPLVAGKPGKTIMDDAMARIGSHRPLVIGDRLDTDIEGATAAGLDSLLVLTGVSGIIDVMNAEPRLRPTYVAQDLRALNVDAERTRIEGTEVSARITVDDGVATVSAHEETTDGLDMIRGLLPQVWARGETVTRVVGADDHTIRLLDGLSLS